ncbi:MAG: lytic transglycosylase domain-containing protein [Pseudomonadota bacterium]
MINRDIGALSAPSMEKKRLPTGLVTIGSDIANGFKIATRRGFVLLSVLAIGTTSMLLVRPELVTHLNKVSPFASDRANLTANIMVPIGKPSQTAMSTSESAKPSTHSAQTTGATALASTQHARHSDIGSVPAFGDFSKKSPAPAATRQQQALVTNWLAKKYRVAGDATDMLVSAAYTTARETKLDPLLILSVMAIESGLNPFAESPVGAQGLMQVMSKIHHEKFQPMGGVKAALNPVANIRVGSLILKDYVNRGGSVEAGLKLYVGAAAFDTDFGYGAKVLAEYQRLKHVATGKTVPTTIAYVAKAKPMQAGPNPAASPLVAVVPSSAKAVAAPASAPAPARASPTTSASNSAPATIKAPEPAKPDAPIDVVPEKVAAL